MNAIIRKITDAKTLTGPRHARIMRPLDENFLEFHHDLLKTEPIHNPSEVFEKVCSDKA